MGFRDELQPIVETELDMTAQVATMISQGYRKAEVMDILGIPDYVYKTHVERLQCLAHKWAGGRVIFLDV
jgi:hypothetical protein